ncbi:MAG: MiaB/RimO family radical SAM methylthiotransferase, partial [Chloroflexi bacterium]|nr:MiaB/RimO family radical SAM methylthiotransferase [Chloroflexota bacterium]
MNQTESEAMSRRLRDAGYDLVKFGERADLYLINTCTVTHVADRKSRQLIRRAKGFNPAGRVAVTGCLVEAAPQDVERMPEVDLLLGKGKQDEVARAFDGALGRPGQAEVASPCSHCRAHAPRTRAFVKVQDGCDAFCSYCIVPYTRGGPESAPADRVVAEIAARVEEGYREVVLTGIHMGKYRSAGGTALVDLIRRILDETGIRRLRLSSVEPRDFPEALLDLMAGGRLARHVHLPLQSGCDATLARMGRGYTAGQYGELAGRIRARVPDAAITTDFMVGFPGETDAEFYESLEFARSVGFSKMHVFPFSVRPGTPAAAMPGQVPESVKKERGEAAR